MEVILHHFPTINDGIVAIEKYYDRLLRLENQKLIDTEQLDWLNWANTYLHQHYNNGQ